jgi:hypothetical protein
VGLRGLWVVAGECLGVEIAWFLMALRFLLSLSWIRYNACGALASMVTGFLCVPLFKFALPALSQ